ncbi:MAG: putative secreted protein [Myxococcota bacterium]|jgi:predicted secreted protein
MLLSLLLFAGCDSDTPAAPKPPASEAPDAVPEVPDPVPPEAAEEANAEASPFVQAVHGIARIDGLSFWGWSADSTVFAFETYYPGSGGASCDEHATLHVVNADTDQYVTPPVTTRYPRVEADICTGPTPQEAIAMLRGDILKQFGISAANYQAPVVNTEKSADWVVEPASGPWFRLTTAVTGTSNPDEYIADAGFKLQMYEVGHAGMPKLIESGKRTRDGVFGYLPVMVFCAPDDEHVAIIVQTSRLDFEGPSYGFMSNGTVRIPGMVVED